MTAHATIDSVYFYGFDHINCRSYYRGRTGRIYCIQDDTRLGRESFGYYLCRDCEPVRDISGPFADLRAEYVRRKLKFVHEPEIQT